MQLIWWQVVASVVDPRARLQLQVRRLIPEDGNTAADLNERDLLPVVFDDLLSFAIIRDISLVVDASAEESCAGALR